MKKQIQREMENVKKMGREINSWLKVFYFFFPWLLYVTETLLFYYGLPPKTNMGFIMILFFYLIPPAGKESMVPAGVILLKPLFGIWSIPITVLSISFVDFFVALWVTWNWDLIKYIPLLGTYVERVEKIGAQKWKEHRYLSKLAYVGLALFVAIPFQGSGGLTATIIGRILGMGKYKVLYTVFFGAIFGTSLIAIATYFAIFTIEQGGILALGGIIIFILVILLIYKWLRSEKK